MAGGPSQFESFDFKRDLRNVDKQPISARQWSAGILPSKFQGITFQSKGDAVHYIGNPDDVCQSVQRQVVEEVNRLNGMLAEERVDPEIQTRIAQYELAFKMQSSVPDLTDFSKEPKEMLEKYGVEKPGDGSLASHCLLARRANDNRRPLANLNGEIVYTNMSNSHFLSSPNETVVVPSGHYFLLGDNSAHSFDSRFLGFVPAKSITGRVIFRK